MVVTELSVPSHETVRRVADPETGLVGFIAVHSTVLGPAAGGLRMRPYANEEAAVEDVLRLSAGMSYKNAAAGLPLGGGKAVIMGDPAQKTTGQLRAFGAAIEALQGLYWTAEDMGMSPDDMKVLRGATRYVAGLAEGRYASGDPSPITARGIFQSIRTTMRTRFGNARLEGRRIALQGLGHVGWELGKLLKAAGADLTVADTDPARTRQAAQCLGATVVAPDEILTAQADLFAPCAVGGILNAQTIPRLRVSAICGGANNQLALPSDAAGLAARSILYAPDYVVNAGGIINVATEILRIRDRESFVEDGLRTIDSTLAAIFAEAARTGSSPAETADHIIAPRLKRPRAA